MPNPVQKPEAVAVADDCSLIVGDCVERLSRFEESTIDAVVTDPPYGLEFMGKDWDALSKTGARVGSSDERWTGADGRSIPSGRVQYGKFNAKVASVGEPTDSFSVQRKGQLPFGGAGQGVQYGNMNTGGQVMQEWHEQWARAVYRVLKPGAYMLCFGGTRTYHRLACAVEDAGFEIRDCIMWVYAVGFPKSLDVSKAIDKHLGAQREKVRHLNPRNPKSLAGGKEIEGGDRPYLVEGRAKGYHDMDGPDPVTAAAAAWDGWGTALKPSFEPVLVCRKPPEGSIAENVLKHGVGGLNIDGCRVGPAIDQTLGGLHRGSGDTVGSFTGEHIHNNIPKGRWPANLVHDGSDEVLEAFAAFGESKSGGGMVNKYYKPSGSGCYQMNATKGPRKSDEKVPGYKDAGTPARFFYCAKANAERDEFNGHPTLKPVALMEWLVKLVCPRDGLVLDPFTGSGTTAIACANTGRKFVGCEKDESYAAIAKTRMAVRKASESIAAPVNGQPGTALGEEL